MDPVLPRDGRHLPVQAHHLGASAGRGTRGSPVSVPGL